MLRASHKLLKPGGRIAYYTIHVAPGLNESDYRRAARVGPTAVSGRRIQLEMLEAADFVGLDQADVTPEFLVTTRAWLEGRERHAKALRKSMGEATLAEKLEESKAQLAAIEEGLLRRSLLTARRQ